MDDDMIVQLFLDRNETAICKGAEKYGALLRSLAFSITADRQCSEECENDAWLAAWNSIPPNEPRTYLFPFLARITRHIAFDRCRERSALKRSAFIAELTDELADCIPSAESVDAVVDGRLLGEAISRFLSDQPKEKRVMFVRKYFYADSIAAIASLLEISEAKVKSTLFRIRRDLRDHLIKEGFTL